MAVLAHQHEFVPSCRIIQTSGPRGRWRSDPESIPQFWRQHGGTGPCRDRRGPGGGDCGSGWRKRTRSRTGASLSPEQTRSSGQGAIGQRQPCPRHTTSHRHLIHHMTERGGGGCSLYSVFVGYYRGSVSGQGSRSAGDVEIRGGAGFSCAVWRSGAQPRDGAETPTGGGPRSLGLGREGAEAFLMLYQAHNRYDPWAGIAPNA